MAVVNSSKYHSYLQDSDMVKIESRPQTRGQRLDIVYSLGSENYSGKNPLVQGSSPCGATHFKFG